ncbi:hypothetical protein L083_4821 [Actinoplanes sp. N902-109]|nr:hypothetical protein L083_4821 [Actinoplanes sp. N902-109]
MVLPRLVRLSLAFGPGLLASGRSGRSCCRPAVLAGLEENSAGGRERIAVPAGCVPVADEPFGGT